MRYFIIFSSLGWLGSLARAQHADGAYAAFLMPAKVRVFADQLWKEGEYARAASEYERLLFMDSSQDAGALTLLIGRSHARAGQYGNARIWFEKALQSSPSDRSRDSALAFLGAIEHLIGNRRLPRLSEAPVFSPNLSPYYTLVGISYWISKQNYEEGVVWLDSVIGRGIPSGPVDNDVRTIIHRQALARRKNPWLAGGLSAVIPGLGKAYCGYPGDGLYSLAIVGGFGLLAYDSFRRHGASTLKGWIFGGATGFFYGGNIYGSVTSALIKNRTQHEKVEHDVELLVRWHFVF